MSASQPDPDINQDIPSIYDVIDPVGAKLGLAGGGLHAYLTGDMLHPPMIVDERMWSEGRLWAQGSAEHATAVINCLDLRFGNRVLDVGCGLGGPARLLVDRFGAVVTSLTSSPQHATTARQLNSARPQWARNIEVVMGDGCIAIPGSQYNAAMSINMFYLVEDKIGMLDNVRQALVPGGRFVIDDWMITDRITHADIEELSFHFNSRAFTNVSDLDSMALEAGFPPIELMLDQGEVGRGPMAQHFEREMRGYFMPRVAADWPGSFESRPGQGAWGVQMVEEWIEGVNVTLRLYAEHKMTYRRFVVRKPF